jgi:hypothetical protein
MTDSSEDQDYDLHLEPQTAAPAPKAAPLSYRALPPVKPSNTDAETLKSLHIPIGLLGGGIVIETIAGFVGHHNLNLALRGVGVDLVIGTTVMMVGIFVAAKFRGIDLGSFRTAALKLAAISVAPSALADLAMPTLGFIPFGGLIAWVGEFFFYFALLGVLFDLDESDTWFCVWTIFIVRIGAYFLLLKMH